MCFTEVSFKAKGPIKSQHWYRQWIRAEQVTIHYLYQYRPKFHGAMVSLGHNELNSFVPHYDGKALSFNPGLQYPYLHGRVHTPDNNRWDTPPVWWC